MPTVARAILIACSLALAGPTHSAMAQGIPESAVKGPVDAAAKDAIRALVDSSKAGLSGDAAAIRRARSALVAPLRTAGVSPDFRTVYTDVLAPVIRPLASDKRDEVAINALVLAGELGTREGAEILTKALSDARPPVRVRAALGFARLFVTFRDSTPAMLAGQVDGVLRTLETALDADKDPMVLDALLAAVESATSVPDTRFEGIRAKFSNLLVQSAGRIIRRPAAADILPIELRSTRVMFELLQDQGLNLPETTLKEAGGLAGDVLVAARRRLNAGALSDAERAKLALIATQADRVYLFALRKLGGNGEEAKLGELIASREDDRFLAESRKIAGPEGALSRPPFALAADRFGN